MKTLNKFLSAALAVGLVVAPLAVNANGLLDPFVDETVRRDAPTEAACLLANNPAHEDFVEGWTWRWIDAVEGIPGVPEEPIYNNDGTPVWVNPDAPEGERVQAMRPPIDEVLAEDAICFRNPDATVVPDPDPEADDVRNPGPAVPALHRRVWNGGIATARAEREALNTAVAAARAAIAAGNDGVRGGAEIDFDFGWTWTHGTGATNGNFWANNIGNDCSARLTDILNRYSDDNQGDVVTDYFLSELLYIQNRYIAANLLTQQQFANALFVGNARIDHGRNDAVRVTGDLDFSTGVNNIPAVWFNTHRNGYALFNLNNASQWQGVFQEGSRYVVFTDGSALEDSFNIVFERGGRGLGRNYDARTELISTRRTRGEMPNNFVWGEFADAQYDLEIANFRTRAVRYQIEEVLVRDCGVDIASNPNATQPATTAPATTAPGATTGGGSQATLPQTNTAVVATGLAGVGVTGLGAVAAFLKNKKA